MLPPSTSRLRFLIPTETPHIGHAYETIAADVLARFKRLDGFDVRFMTGTDEHGQKMQTTAEKQGKTAKELADENSARFKDDERCSRY